MNALEALTAMLNHYEVQWSGVVGYIDELRLSERGRKEPTTYHEVRARIVSDSGRVNHAPLKNISFALPNRPA